MEFGERLGERKEGDGGVGGGDGSEEVEESAESAESEEGELGGGVFEAGAEGECYFSVEPLFV